MLLVEQNQTFFQTQQLDQLSVLMESVEIFYKIMYCTGYFSIDMLALTNTSKIPPTVGNAMRRPGLPEFRKIKKMILL